MVHKIIPSIDKNALDGINIDGKLVTNPLGKSEECGNREECRNLIHHHRIRDT